MDEDQSLILAREKFSSFEENNEQILDRKSVERLKDQGLMTEDSILERFTVEICSTLFFNKDDHVENIKNNFEAIKASSSNQEAEGESPIFVSNSAFTSFLLQRFSGFEDYIKDGIVTIYESALVYGNFPFPPDRKTTPGLTFEQFLRAVAFMWDTQPYNSHDSFYSHESFMGGFGDLSGDLGPHTGFYVHSRHRGHQDRRRLDFRALAVRPVDIKSSEEQRNCTKITVTYFKEYALDEGFDDTCLELGFADDEDERGIDVVDVLSVTYPKDPDPMVGPPMLSSLRSVAAHLPKQPSSLSELRIPYSKLFGFVKLLLFVQLRDFGGVESYFVSQLEDLNVSAKYIMNSFVGGEDISWEAFDEVIRRNLPAFFLGGLHHIARPFLSPIEPNQSSSGNSLLKTLSNSSGILRYPILAQLHTFFPSRAGDIEWNNLHKIQSHNKSNPLTLASLKSALHAYKTPTILLLSGYQADILKPSSKTYVVVGALIRSPWTAIEADCQDETRLWKTMLFQLAPVQRVYATRKEEHNSFPVLQAEGIGIGREVTGSSMEAELGTTGLIINANLDTAVFEHGKRDSRDGVFETFCPFGVGMEGPSRMEVSALEVWGC